MELNECLSGADREKKTSNVNDGSNTGPIDEESNQGLRGKNDCVLWGSNPRSFHYSNTRMTISEGIALSRAP